MQANKYSSIITPTSKNVKLILTRTKNYKFFKKIIKWVTIYFRYVQFFNATKINFFFFKSFWLNTIFFKKNKIILFKQFNVTNYSLYESCFSFLNNVLKIRKKIKNTKNLKEKSKLDLVPNYFAHLKKNYKNDKKITIRLIRLKNQAKKKGLNFKFHYSENYFFKKVITSTTLQNIKTTINLNFLNWSIKSNNSIKFFKNYFFLYKLLNKEQQKTTIVNVNKIVKKLKKKATNCFFLNEFFFSSIQNIKIYKTNFKNFIKHYNYFLIKQYTTESFENTFYSSVWDEEYIKVKSKLVYTINYYDYHIKLCSKVLFHTNKNQLYNSICDTIRTNLLYNLFLFKKQNHTVKQNANYIQEASNNFYNLQSSNAQIKKLFLFKKKISQNNFQNMFMRQYIGGFFENLFRCKIFFIIKPFIKFSKSVENFLNLTMVRHKIIQKNIGVGFFFDEMMFLLWYSLFEKDPKIFMAWFCRTLTKMPIKKHKIILRTFKTIISHYVDFFLNGNNLTGLKFDIRGKVGVSGDSKKRHFFFNLGLTSFSKKKSRITYNQGLVYTDTGVMGVTLIYFF